MNAIPSPTSTKHDSKATTTTMTAFSDAIPTSPTSGKGPKSIPSKKDKSPPAAKGSVKLIFSTLQRKYGLLLFIAVGLAMACGGIPPLMTIVLGNAFDAYTSYNVNRLPSSEVPQSDKDQLLSRMMTSVWQLCTLAVATLLLATTMITLWIVIGEKVVAGWRSKVFASVSRKEME